MIRTLVVAPQWIGDAVMSEPLLAALHARGERIAVAALPWVAPVYRAMPQVAEVIELPFAHGRFDCRSRAIALHVPRPGNNDFAQRERALPGGPVTPRRHRSDRAVFKHAAAPRSDR